MCSLLFTSGTTGMSKGVMLCHRNFCYEVMSAMGVIKITPDDCGISMLPLHHTYESTIILFFAPYCGAKVTFCDGFKYVLKNMKEFNPSVFVAVPLLLETVHRRLMKAIKNKPHGETLFKVGKVLVKAAAKIGIDLKKVFFKEIIDTFGGNMRLIICGAAPINPQILKDFEAFGIQIIFGYGLTECAPLAIINHDKLHMAESVGVPIPGSEAKILNPDPDTGVGEICVRGGMVMLGYYNNPEETAKVIDEEGWFHTGDLGYVDKEGHYFISGRSKNVIVTSNGKISIPKSLSIISAPIQESAKALLSEMKTRRAKQSLLQEFSPTLRKSKTDTAKMQTNTQTKNCTILWMRLFSQSTISFLRTRESLISKSDVPNSSKTQPQKLCVTRIRINYSSVQSSDCTDFTFFKRRINK